MALEEALIWLRGLGDARRALRARLEAKPSTWVITVQKTPDLLPKRRVRAGTPVVIHDQIRQVGLCPSSKVQGDNFAGITQAKIPTLGDIRRCRNPTG